MRGVIGHTCSFSMFQWNVTTTKSFVKSLLSAILSGLPVTRSNRFHSVDCLAAAKGQGLLSVTVALLIARGSHCNIF